MVGLLGIICQSALSQTSLPEEKIKFDILSIEKGLSQSTVLSIFQDKEGYIWAGTRNGLNKYNGYSFEIFQNRVNDSSSISGNIINDIKEDHTGLIYVGTDKGLSQYRASSNSFTNHELPPQYKTSEIKVIEIDKSNRIWIGTKAGLFLFDATTNSFAHLSGLKPSFGLKSQASIHSMLIENDSLLWVGTTYRGLYAVNINHLETNQDASFHISSETFGNAWIEAILPATENQLWVATYGRGLYLVEREGKIVERYTTDSANKLTQITHNNIRALSYDNEGNLWIGTFEGLNILKKNTAEIVQIHYQKGDVNGLSHGSIRAIKKDSKGSLWIGTYFGGISIFDRDNQKFAHYYNIPGKSTSLNYNIVGAFSEDSTGNTLIGTERGGINVFSGENKNHKSYPLTKNDELSGLTVKSIFTDRSGNHWIGSFKDGLKKLSLFSGEITDFPVEKSRSEFQYMQKAIINCIIEDEHGLLWLGLDGLGGVAVFDPQKMDFIEHPIATKMQESLQSASVKNILIDKSGDFFISTRGEGLFQFRRSDGKLTQYESIIFKGIDIDLKEANHILEHDGALWVATHGSGLVKMNKEQMSVEQHWFDADGLISNIIFGTLVDNQQNIWLLTPNGIAKIFEENNKMNFKNYTFSSGFPIQEINEGSFFKTSEGEFLIGGNNGYVRFDPEDLADNSLVPPIVFTDLKIANNSVKPGDHHDILHQDLHQTSEITLDYFQSVVTLEFAALNYLRPENNQYAYQLQGFNNEWNYIGNKRSATFTNLQDGTYYFKVKGSNNDGVWNENARTLTIHMLPPPWKTWWAFLIYAIIIISGFFIVRQNAIKGAKMKMSLKLEQIEKEKWKEIHQLKLKYFTDVSHEFRTPLTLITNPLEEILQSNKGGKWIRKRLRTMQHSSRRMLLLIDQILEIRELETGHSRLKLAPVHIESQVRQIVDSFKALADKKQIRLNYQPETIEQKHLVDADKLEKIFYNLLSNAFKFTPEGGVITVKFSLKPNEKQDVFVFEIVDTGIGISKENIDKIYDRFYTNRQDGSGAGIGLSLTKSLVAINKGEIAVESSKSEGTRFTIQIPFSRAQGNLPSEHFLGKSNKNPLVPPDIHQTLTFNDKKIPEEDLISEETILIAEDTVELRNYLKEQLGKKYRIIVTTNGKEALEKIRKKGASLVLSDVMMPEMDGFELCKQIKSEPELCHIPVILLTAKSSHVDRLEGLEYGADDYISKPFIMREVKTRIKNILANRKILHEKFKSNSYLPDLTKTPVNSLDEKLLKNLVQTVENNIDEPTLTVEFLSKKLGLSRVHLFRKLKVLLGTTPTDFIKDFRMKRAASLLQQQKLNVSEIAYSVGFQDVHYFGKCFRKAYGVSPSQYSKDQEDSNRNKQTKVG